MAGNSVLGPFGELMWRTIPELRPAVCDMIRERLELAIRLDEDPDIDMSHFSSVIFDHIIRPMRNGTEDPRLVSRLAELVRAVADYGGEEVDRFRDQVDLFWFENLQSEPALTKLDQADPGIAAMVMNPFPDNP